MKVCIYYDGTGTLLKRRLSNNVVWTYIDDLVIKNDTLYQVNHDEGRVTYDATNDKYTYEYEYRDIWGNLRLSFRDSLAAPVSGVGRPPVVVQANDYDPWGVVLNQISFVNNQNAINNFDYSNRERQTDFGLNIMALGARIYDPTIARFWSSDPLIEAGQQSFTPYHYSYNNPIRFNDPDGLMGEECCDDGADGIGNGMTMVENIYWSTRDALVSSVATVSTFIGSFFSDTKTQRVNATYENGKRTLSSEVVPKGEVAKEVVASTVILATAVPSGGSGSNAGTGILLAKTGPKASTASSLVKTIKEQTEEIKTTLNGNKNSVTVKTTTGHTRYDLAGKAHAGVDTPHVQKYKNNVVEGIVKSITRESKTAVQMTQQEIRAIRKFLEKLI